MKPSSLLLVLLAGCATDFSRTATPKLCTDYLAYPAYNIHQGAREAELAKRGESCAAYVGAGVAQRQANDALLIEGARILTQPQPIPPRPVHCYTNPYGHTVCN